MSPSRVLAVGFTLALSLVIGRRGGNAVEHPTRFPLAPYADAKVGDWSVHTGCIGSLVKGKLCEKVTLVVSSRVEKVEGDVVTVTISTTTRVESKPIESEARVQTKTFSKNELPALEKEFGTGITFEPYTDDTKRIGDRDFACRRTELSGRVHGTAWFAAEAKGWGVLAWSFVGAHDIDSPVARYEMTLAGYGTAERTLWGKHPDEFSKTMEVAHH